MKLLITTQAVDVNDPILSFFHNWILEFSKRCEKVTVICLREGRHSLPVNVKVLSLGKEGGVSRAKYIWRFYKYIWQERKSYDAVFAHMNQEYVLLGGLLWHLWCKRIKLWRNHPMGTPLTRIATLIADELFCTSRYAFVTRYRKTKIAPAGIDVELFKDFGRSRAPNSVLCLGRVAPIKKLDVVLRALGILYGDGVKFSATIVGDAVVGDEPYLAKLKHLASELGISEQVAFRPSVVQADAVRAFNESEIVINATPTGSFDKTILEAMACGAIVITSNRSFAGKIPDNLIFEEGNFTDLAAKLKATLLSLVYRRTDIVGRLKDFVVTEHCLKKTIDCVLGIWSHKPLC